MSDLRDLMAEAITREHYRRAEQRIEASPEEHGRAFADAAMTAVQPELDAKGAALDTYTTDVLRVLQAKNEALERAELRIDRQVRRGDRLAEQVQAKDARIAELEARVDRFKKQRAGWSGISDLRTEANEYEAERDRLRARLTGVAIHAHRLANCIGPGTPAWSALADLRAALDQPKDTP